MKHKIKDKRIDYGLILAGFVMIVVSLYLLSGQMFLDRVSKVEAKAEVNTNPKLLLLQKINQSVVWDDKIVVTEDRFYVKIGSDALVLQLVPDSISVTGINKDLSLIDSEVYVDNNFLNVGDGYLLLLGILDNGKVAILYRATIINDGSRIVINPVGGVMLTYDKKGKRFSYLSPVGNSVRTFNEYDSVVPQLSYFLTPDGKLKDIVSLKPIPLNNFWESG